MSSPGTAGRSLHVSRLCGIVGAINTTRVLVSAQAVKSSAQNRSEGAVIAWRRHKNGSKTLIGPQFLLRHSLGHIVRLLLRVGHADQAAVNVNFWITPDEANTNPASGGMVIWDVAAPQDWDARIYNGDDAAARAFLERSGAKPRTVPHRANRAVIFDSDLFHKTDEIDFKEGYLNRRINLTMLYGRRT